MEDDLRDPLTGLFRAWPPPADREDVWRPRLALERAATWLAAPPPDTVFLLIDLRDFKRVNDEHSFMAGDRHLAEVGRRIGDVAAGWPAYRTGGDEFLVALRLPDEDAIRASALEIRARLEEPHEGIYVRTWAAAGRAAVGDAPDLLFRRTDRALGAAIQNRWSELVIAPPQADETTWYERPSALPPGGGRAAAVSVEDMFGAGWHKLSNRQKTDFRRRFAVAMGNRLDGQRPVAGRAIVDLLIREGWLRLDNEAMASLVLFKDHALSRAESGLCAATERPATTARAQSVLYLALSNPDYSTFAARQMTALETGAAGDGPRTVANDEDLRPFITLARDTMPDQGRTAMADPDRASNEDLCLAARHIWSTYAALPPEDRAIVGRWLMSP